MPYKPGVYIHIPFCKARCNYCAFVSSTDFSYMQSYVDALCGEIKSCKPKDNRIDTVYIGGGTPSCLYRGALKRIFDELRAVFDIDTNSEITVEANPESCDEAFVEEAVSCGVNRISMGLQSACDGTLKAIGRLHDVKGFVDAVRLVKSHGIDNISSDIIIGLPGQTEGDVKTAIRLACEHCDHISVYGLTVEEGTPLYNSGYTPDDDNVADLYDIARGALDKLGFKRYEVSNFARNGRISRHNSKYWWLIPYYAFGAGAHGYDGERIRYRHSESVAEYIAKRKIYKEKLSDKDVYNEYVILALRTERGICYDDFAERFGKIFGEKIFEMADNLVKQGYLLHSDGYLRIPPSRMYVMNSIIRDLMLD